MNSPNPCAPMRLRLHGVPGWQQGDGPWQTLERKHAALLAWLWLEGTAPRSRLAGLLWPGVPEDRARGNLRQRLLKLRQEAGELVQDESGLLRLAPRVDVQPPMPPGAALLDTLNFDDCESLSRWIDTRREAARDQRKREWLAEVREAAQGERLDDALYAADQLLQTDRESEEAYRVLMEVYYLRGDQSAAISAWDRCREMLRQLYGARPSAATQQLGQSIVDAAASAQAAQQTWAPTPNATRHLPVTVLRPPRLVGRGAAMQALVDAWHAGQTACVLGVAGVGKSRLLADWTAGLGACAAAAARPGDAVLPYASLSRLMLAAIDRFKPALDSPDALQAARLLPRLATLTGQIAEPVHTDYERTRALLALGRWLGSCARSGAQAFVLDDLQFADPASLAALRVLAEPPPARTVALRFAFGLRADESTPEVDALMSSLAAGGHLARVELATLSAAHAQELLTSLEVQALDAAAWAEPLWRQVGGNPAFLLESVKLLLSMGSHQMAFGAVLPLPASIEAVIQRRIELLSPRARHLAQLAAIAGSAYSIALAASALACGPLELSEPLRELELRQVFSGRHFVHDVIASVVARSVPGTVAEFMHRFVAEHLTNHAADTSPIEAQIAGHWLACAEYLRAGHCFTRAAEAARLAALANEQATLLDSAIAAFEQDTAAHEALFDALAARANVYESQGHEGLRPQFIARLQVLARSEGQRLVALNHHYGWLTNLAQTVDENEALNAIERAADIGRPALAWELARVLAWQWAMSNRANEGLALLARQQRWIDEEANAVQRGEWLLARANIFAFGDRLPEAIAQAHQALQAFVAARDWPNALPAMSNLGVMHYWRGEYGAALQVLSQAREHRERLYGGRGSGIKIDIHLGAVLYEMGRPEEARTMLEGALAEIATWPDNEYRRTESLLAHNHLAQMHLAMGQSDAATAALTHDATGVAERFYGRRLTLRLRWQRLFGTVDSALRDELQALAARLASPFNRTLMELELARHLPALAALAEFARVHDSAVAVQRPGLQLHAAALAAQAAAQVCDMAMAGHWRARAQTLRAHCEPFDLSAQELHALLAVVPA